MPEALKVVPVSSAMRSKINLTQPVAMFAQGAALWMGRKYGLDGMVQGAIAVVIQVVFGAATMVFRTWYTTTVTPQSVPS